MKVKKDVAGRVAELFLLSGGAAFGLINGIRTQFEAENSCRIKGEFGAVGFMKEKLLSGTRCDAVILSRKLIDELAASHIADPRTVRDLGRVSTGIALKSQQEKVHVGSSADLKTALLEASRVFVPDMQKSTAGIHMKRVFGDLGIFDRIRDKIREYPNGAGAMKALAAEPSANPIGCTQATEILYTSGVDLIDTLPAGCELDTVYSMAIPATSLQADLARKLADFLSDDALKEFKKANGFGT